MKTSHILFTTVLAAQQATATWNLFGLPFLTPDYNPNECSDKQKKGFDWSDLMIGAKNFQYGDFDFSSGWTCSNTFGKRDLLSKRTFGTKCITNFISKTKPATFSCSKRKTGFSITDIDVSLEYDADIELHYGMQDGSTCKQYASCTKQGTTINNTQCGGAQSVSVYLGGGQSGSKSSCEIGLHRIGFDCNPSKNYNPTLPPISSAISKPATSKTVPTSPVESCVGESCGSSPPSTSTPGACDDDDCLHVVTSKTQQTLFTTPGRTPESSPPPPVQTLPTPPSSSTLPFQSLPASSSPPVQSIPASSLPAQAPPISGPPPVQSSPVSRIPPVQSSPISSFPSVQPPVSSPPPVQSSPISSVSSIQLPSSPIQTPDMPTPPPVGAPIPSCRAEDGGDCDAPVQSPSSPATVTFPPMQTPETSNPPTIVTSTPSCDGGYGSGCESPEQSPSMPVQTPESSTPPPAQSSGSTSSPAQTPTSCVEGYGGGCAFPVDSPSSALISSFSLLMPPVSTSIITNTLPSSEQTSNATPPSLPTPLSLFTPLQSGPYTNSDKSTVTCAVGYGGACAVSTTVPMPPISSGPNGSRTPSAPSYSPSSPSYPPTSPGDILPRCMNTWLQVQTKCKDNSDQSCYCVNIDFTKSVIDCVTARCSNSQDTRSALQYLVGICAAYVPQNPSLITYCPVGTFDSSTPSLNISSPSQNISASATVLAPSAPSLPVTAITYGSGTVTVPQVHFSTNIAAVGGDPANPVGLVAGAGPTETAATMTTGYYPVPSTFRASNQPTGTGARSSSPAQFTGAASWRGAKQDYMLVVAGLAIFAL